MNHLPLLVAMPPKLVSWLTPLWLLGVGVFLGLLLFLFIWAAAAILSRIGFIGRLADDRRRAVRWTTIITLVGGAAGTVFLGITRWSALTEAGDGNALAAIGSLVSLTLPAMIFLWLGVFGVVMLVWRRTVAEMPLALVEGVLWPLLVTSTFLAGFGFMGFFATENPLAILKTLGRVTAVGTETFEFTLDSGELDAENPKLQQRSVGFRVNEIATLVIRTDQRLTVTRDLDTAESYGQSIEVLPDEDYQVPLAGLLTGSESEQIVESLYFGNLGDSPAKVSATVRTMLVYPQVWVVPWTAACLVLLMLIYIVQRVAFPRLSAVALSTYKSEVAQPLFSMLLGIGALSLILFIWIPYNTFGEDIKMLKDTGLTLIMVLSILLALWSASSSISEEIEGRTALTVLSKPLTRRSFVIGKFVGIAWTVCLMFIVLGVVFLLVVAYKPIFDAKENTTANPPWQVCFQEMMHVVPGLVLAFMETLVLAALSVAISTRLPLLANFTICLSIYALGHLTPMIVQSSMGSFPIVGFFGQLIATVFPNLDHFNIQAAVAAGVGVPLAYLAWAFVYCLIYTVIAVLLALVMFEDRDLT
jgi:ABC-type transport system involved in multi-copper enzyme maturation permease subunit